MEIDPKTLAPRDAYRLLITLVVPRPIAWLSTVDEEGRANLAPFSFFGGVSSRPMTVMVSIGRRGPAKDPKDTAHNLLRTREAVIHVPDRPRAEAMVATSADVGPEIDEFDLAALGKAPSRRVAPPRITEAPIAMEAVLTRHLEIGEGPATDLFLLEIVHLHLAPGCLDGEGRPDPKQLAAIGRLGASLYVDTAHPFEIRRPR